MYASVSLWLLLLLLLLLQEELEEEVHRYNTRLGGPLLRRVRGNVYLYGIKRVELQVINSKLMSKRLLVLLLLLLLLSCGCRDAPALGGRRHLHCCCSVLEIHLRRNSDSCCTTTTTTTTTSSTRVSLLWCVALKEGSMEAGCLWRISQLLRRLRPSIRSPYRNDGIPIPPMPAATPPAATAAATAGGAAKASTIQRTMRGAPKGLYIMTEGPW